MGMGSTDEGERYLDTRDLIARIEELRSDRDGWVLGAPDGSETPNPEGWADDEPDDAAELATLESFMDEMKGYGGDEQWEGDWYPVTLIREDVFQEYAEEMADDLHGKEMRDLSWPFQFIDWEAAANALRVAYGSATYGSTEYLYR